MSSASQPAVLHIAKGSGVSLLLHLLAAPSSSSTALGNASLCIGELAKHQELLPILSRQDAVASLLGTILPFFALLVSSGSPLLHNRRPFTVVVKYIPAIPVLFLSDP